MPIAPPITGNCSSVMPSCSISDSFPPNSSPRPADFFLTLISTLLELGQEFGLTSPTSMITMQPSQSLSRLSGVPILKLQFPPVSPTPTSTSQLPLIFSNPFGQDAQPMLFFIKWI